MKKGIEKMSDLEIVKALWGIYCEGKKNKDYYTERKCRGD